MGVKFSVLMGEVLHRSVLTNVLLSFGFIDEAQPCTKRKCMEKSEAGQATIFILT